MLVGIIFVAKSKRESQMIGLCRARAMCQFHL